MAHDRRRSWGQRRAPAGRHRRSCRKSRRDRRDRQPRQGNRRSGRSVYERRTRIARNPRTTADGSGPMSHTQQHPREGQGVTAPVGFRASGVTAGLKPSGTPDVALVVNDGPDTNAAAVFTSNRCKANPVLWSERTVVDGRLAAVVLNSGGANCYNGPEGFQTTHASAELVAELIGCAPFDVATCSTGMIGTLLDRSLLEHGIGKAHDALADDGGPDAARAIMTTDTAPKEATVTGPGAAWTVGGMAKGAGMLAPALATMLVVVTTDARVDPDVLDRALRTATATTDRKSTRLN